MTSYLNSLTSHYNSIKRLLPTQLSPDADNSISDPADSHVSRVLRAYYTEKGRPFPPWLGPDPNAPVRAQPNYVSQSRTGAPTAATGVGGMGSARRGGGGLGDLFGDNNAAQTPPQEEPMSLRSRRGAGFKAQAPLASTPPIQTSQPTARPLPSQRQGSYQNRSNDTGGNGFAAPVVKEQTAQERLRARLGNNRGSSPATTPSASAFDTQSNSRNDSGFGFYDSRGSSNPYDTGGSGGGGFNPYESGGGGGFNPYDTGSKNPYAPSGDRQRPYAASNSPWNTGDESADLGSGAGRRGLGLPTNPRARRG